MSILEQQIASFRFHKRQVRIEKQQLLSAQERLDKARKYLRELETLGCVVNWEEIEKPGDEEAGYN